MSLRQDEKPLITFHTTPSAIDTEVDYLQHFDESEINKATLRELAQLLQSKAQRIFRFLEQIEHKEQK